MKTAGGFFGMILSLVVALTVMLSSNNFRKVISAMARGRAELFPSRETGQPLPPDFTATIPYIRLPIVVATAADAKPYTVSKNLETLYLGGQTRP